MKYFSFDEFQRSATAVNRMIDNSIPPVCKRNIVKLVVHILDPAREAMGKPIIVTSGYRCQRLNDIIAGASQHSLHIQGKAADISCGNATDNALLLEILKQRPCYELIPYRSKIDGSISRIHVSYNDGRRHYSGWFSKFE